MFGTSFATEESFTNTTNEVCWSKCLQGCDDVTYRQQNLNFFENYYILHILYLKMQLIRILCGS